MIEVSIVEDDSVFREGLVLILNGTPGYSCIDAFEDCETAIEIVLIEDTCINGA